MPAEHCTSPSSSSSPSSVLVSKDVVAPVLKHYNKVTSASLKRRTCDGSSHNHRHSGFAPHKRRRVESRSEGHCNVRKSHKHANNVKQLTHILGISKPSDQLQEQIQALQHILSLVELPVTPPPSPPCSQISQWNVKLYDTEKEGSCEVLASATLNIKEDLLAIPFNSYASHPFFHYCMLDINHQYRLPTELVLRETIHKCVWRHLKSDLTITEVNVEFLSTDSGKLFRHMLWRTRKSAVFTLPNSFELHLVPQSVNTSDEEPLVGYICPVHHASILAEIHTPTPVPLLIQTPVTSTKPLAAALDIDDTLVRLIPAADKDKYPSSRIRTLPMFGENPEWVLALSTHVNHFLSQLATKYHLALYSVGVPEYVIQVAHVLDPQRTLLDWSLLDEGLSSARHEHDHGDTSPKHFAKLFSFVNKVGGVEDWGRCVGVDDSCGAWSPSCRDRIVDPQPALVEGVWDSNLLQALERLEDVYNKFHDEDCNKLSAPYVMQSCTPRDILLAYANHKNGLIAQPQLPQNSNNQQQGVACM